MASGTGRSIIVGPGKADGASIGVVCLVVDDSKPDEVDGASVGTNRDVAAAPDSGEVDVVSAGIVRVVADGSSRDGIVEVPSNVSRDIVEGPNSGQVYGLRECSGRTSP